MAEQLLCDAMQQLYWDWNRAQGLNKPISGGCAPAMDVVQDVLGAVECAIMEVLFKTTEGARVRAGARANAGGPIG